MNNRRMMLGGIALVVLIAAGIFLYDFVLGEPEEASAPIEAIPLALETPAEPTEPAAPAEVAVEPTDMPAAPTAAPAVEATAEPEPTAEPAASNQPAQAGELVVFEIVQAGSQTRFILDEDLRGVRTTVIGSTDQVAGQLALNLADLSTAQVGVIQVNARTLLTDNNFRNNAIRNRILNTDQYEFITFTPTELIGLPASVSVGETVSFQLAGDLTIRDITNPVVFEVTATATAADRIEGQASTVVTRGDFNLVIPQVQGVANVDEDVAVEITFVATTP